MSNDQAMRVVPVEPTREMLVAGANAGVPDGPSVEESNGVYYPFHEGTVAYAWKAMLAAAPEPVGESVAQKVLLPAYPVVFNGTCSDGTLRVQGEFVTKGVYDRLRNSVIEANATPQPAGEGRGLQLSGEIVVTKEMLVAGMKCAGAYAEPFEPATECGVAIEMGMTQEDCDSVNAETMDSFGDVYKVMRALEPAAPAVAPPVGVDELLIALSELRSADADVQMLLGMVNCSPEFKTLIETRIAIRASLQPAAALERQAGNNMRSGGSE